MKSAFLLSLVLIFTCAWVFATDLPRKVKTSRESYRDVDVIYDSVATSRGERLRIIITKPSSVKGNLPVVFVAGWLSCDSVEAPENTRDETGMLFRQLAQLSGFCLLRVDKQGVGDSEGNCAENDFDSELAGYRAAFRALKNYDFVDTDRIYLLGISNGGGFAPIVPETAAEQGEVRGLIVVGGWVKTWFEHMMEIERRRFGLMGKTPAEVTEQMKGAATLYHEWLIKKRKITDILRENATLADLWPGGRDREHLYGRPLAFYEQLQNLNLAAAWSKVKVPTLVLHGQYDWIMSRDDHELIAQCVNANSPGAARFVEIPAMGHTLQSYTNWADAFANKSSGLNQNGARLIIDWLIDQEHAR